MKFKGNQVKVSKEGNCGPSRLSWLDLKSTDFPGPYTLRPITEVHSSSFFSPYCKLTYEVNFGDSQWVDLGVAAHLVTSGQTHALVPHWREGSLTESREASEEGLAFRQRASSGDLLSALYVFFHSCGGRLWRAKLEPLLLIALPFIPDLILHDGLAGLPCPSPRVPDSGITGYVVKCNLQLLGSRAFMGEPLDISNFWYFEFHFLLQRSPCPRLIVPQAAEGGGCGGLLWFPSVLFVLPQSLPLVCSRASRGLWGRVREWGRYRLMGHDPVFSSGFGGRLLLILSINYCSLNTVAAPSNQPLTTPDINVQPFMGLSCCAVPTRTSWAELCISWYILATFCRVHMEPKGNLKPRHFPHSHVSCFYSLGHWPFTASLVAFSRLGASPSPAFRQKIELSELSFWSPPQVKGSISIPSFMKCV